MAPVDVDIRPLDPRDIPSAALVAARGMRDNPAHIAAIGNDPAKRVRVMERLFRQLLALDHRPTFVAWEGDRLVGVADSAEPGHCQPSGLARAKLLPALLMAGTAVPRMTRWIGAWEKRDPGRAHSHFGPFAVDLDAQGRGIGTQLLAHYCRTMDETATFSYLETDKPENVRLYERFGYVVIEKATVIGADNWFMTREPGSR
jgi:ribosomal protein S18 acetylase RimI-like enzyme